MNTVDEHNIIGVIDQILKNPSLLALIDSDCLDSLSMEIWSQQMDRDGDVWEEHFDEDN